MQQGGNYYRDALLALESAAIVLCPVVTGGVAQRSDGSIEHICSVVSLHLLTSPFVADVLTTHTLNIKQPTLEAPWPNRRLVGTLRWHLEAIVRVD